MPKFVDEKRKVLQSLSDIEERLYTFRKTLKFGQTMKSILDEIKAIENMVKQLRPDVLFLGDDESV